MTELSNGSGSFHVPEITPETKPDVTKEGSLQRIMDLRIMGFSYRAIGEEVGVSHQTISNWLHEMLDELHKQSLKSTSRLRLLEVNRCNKVMVELWRKLAAKDSKLDEDGQIKFLAELRKWVELKAKFEGTMMPVKIAPTDPTGEREWEGLKLDERKQRLGETLGLLPVVAG